MTYNVAKILESRLKSIEYLESKIREVEDECNESGVSVEYARAMSMLIRTDEARLRALKREVDALRGVLREREARELSFPVLSVHDARGRPQGRPFRQHVPPT